MALTPLMVTALTELQNHNCFHFPKVDPLLRATAQDYAGKELPAMFKKLLADTMTPEYFALEPNFTKLKLPSWAKRDLLEMAQEFPYLTDINPTSYSFLSSDLINHVYGLCGDGDNTKFVQNLEKIVNFMDSTNSAIDSANASKGVAKSTFTSMDNLITGNVTLVTTDTKLFSEDLINTGLLFDFSDIDNFGTPHALIHALIRSHSITYLTDEFAAQGIELPSLISSILESKVPLLLPIQKIIYDIATTITGDKLDDILALMIIVNPNIETLADLIDIRKVLPNSYPYLRSLNAGVVSNIFSGNDISSWVSELETTSIAVMPENIARANYAFSIALEQITNITFITPEELANNIADLEVTTDLSTIKSMPGPVDPAIVDTLTSTIGKGTDTDGKFKVIDAFQSLLTTTHVETMIAIDRVYDYVAENNVDTFDKIYQIIRAITTLAYIPYKDEMTDNPLNPSNYAGDNPYDTLNNDLYDPITRLLDGMYDPTTCNQYNPFCPDGGDGNPLPVPDTYNLALHMSGLIGMLRDKLNSLSSSYNTAKSISSNPDSLLDASAIMAYNELYILTQSEVCDGPFDKPKEEDFIGPDNKLIVMNPRIDQWGVTVVFDNFNQPLPPKPDFWNVKYSAKNSVMAATQFIEKLPTTVANKTEQGDIVDVLTQFYKPGPGSQAIEAVLKEARNQEKLDKAGIATNTMV